MEQYSSTVGCPQIAQCSVTDTLALVNCEHLGCQAAPLLTRECLLKDGYLSFPSTFNSYILWTCRRDITYTWQVLPESDLNLNLNKQEHRLLCPFFLNIFSGGKQVKVTDLRNCLRLSQHAQTVPFGSISDDLCSWYLTNKPSSDLFDLEK